MAYGYYRKIRIFCVTLQVIFSLKDRASDGEECEYCGLTLLRPA